MGVEIKSLKSGVMSSTSKSDIYEAPASKSVIVKNIRMVNVHATNGSTINMYLKQSGETERAILPVGVSLPAKQLLIDEDELTMSEGDKIQGDATGGTVEIVISGIEREVV